MAANDDSCGLPLSATINRQYEQAFLFIDRRLQKLQPSAQPKEREILPLLTDFPTLWQQMTLTERRAILQTMFAGLYFDADHELRKATAHSPFDQLLGLVQVCHAFGEMASIMNYSYGMKKTGGRVFFHSTASFFNGL